MTTPYDRDIKRQVMSHNQAFVDRLKVRGQGDIMGFNANTAYQTYRPSHDEIRYGEGHMYGSGAVEMGVFEPRMFGNGRISVLEQAKPMERRQGDCHLAKYADGISQGSGKGTKKYKKGGAHLEGGNFWDSISSGLGDVWSGVKSVASDVVDDTQDVFHAGLDLATQAGQTGIGLAGQAGEMAIQHAPEMMQFVAENPELLAGAGKSNPWVFHVKAFAKNHQLSYRDALKSKKCSDCYKKQGERRAKAEPKAKAKAKAKKPKMVLKKKVNLPGVAPEIAPEKKPKMVLKKKVNLLEVTPEKKPKLVLKKKVNLPGVAPEIAPVKPKMVLKKKVNLPGVAPEIAPEKKPKMVLKKKVNLPGVAPEVGSGKKGGSRRDLTDIADVLNGGYWNAEEPKIKNGLKGRKADIKVQDLPDVKILGGGKKTSPWISHVKAFAVKHKCTYRDALRSKECKDTYKRKA